MKELLERFLKISLCIFITSCSVSTPEIKDFKWDIKIVKDLQKDIIYESLSIFVNCYDEDGENDIDTLYFINDDSGIYWELNSDEWQEKFIEDDRWIGSNSIIMPDRSPIPRDSLRIHIRDLAGESVEEKLYIVKKRHDFKTLKFPELIIDDDKFKLRSYEAGRIFLYSDNDDLIADGQISNSFTTFDEIFQQERADFDDSFRFHVIINDGDLILESGPWY